MIIGNSNVRGWSQELSLRGVDSTSYVFPSGTVNEMKSRIPNFKNNSLNPSHIMLHFGDVEARQNDLNTHVLEKDLSDLKIDIKKMFPASKILISGLPSEGVRKLHTKKNIAIINSILQRSSDATTDSIFLDNKKLLVKDGIHFSKKSVNEICRTVACFVKKCKPE